MKSDWLHTSQGVWARLYVLTCVCVCAWERQEDGDSFLNAFRRQWNHTQELWYNWESTVKGARLRGLGGAVRSQEPQPESRKAVGVWVAFLPTGGGWHLLWMDETAGQEEPEAVCYLKSSSLSVYAWFLRSLHLCVIRVLAGRMISCHPQWWPSTAWMSTLSETSCLSEQHTQLETLTRCRSW